MPRSLFHRSGINDNTMLDIPEDILKQIDNIKTTYGTPVFNSAFEFIIQHGKQNILSHRFVQKFEQTLNEMNSSKETCTFEIKIAECAKKLCAFSTQTLLAYQRLYCTCDNILKDKLTKVRLFEMIGDLINGDEYGSISYHALYRLGFLDDEIVSLGFEPLLHEDEGDD